MPCQGWNVLILSILGAVTDFGVDLLKNNLFTNKVISLCIFMIFQAFNIISHRLDENETDFY